MGRLLEGNRLNQERLNQVSLLVETRLLAALFRFQEEKNPMEYFRAWRVYLSGWIWPPDEMWFPQCTFRRKSIVRAVRLLDRLTLGKWFPIDTGPVNIQ